MQIVNKIVLCLHFEITFKIKYHKLINKLFSVYLPLKKTFEHVYIKKLEI